MFYFSAVDGLSMQPLINNQIRADSQVRSQQNKQQKDFVFIQRPWTWMNPMLFATASRSTPHIEKLIRRGDVVSLVSPKNVNECFIKRVIGLPGDVVRTIRYKEKYVVVPQGHCWVEGDNFKASYDSNSFGCIPMGLIIGQAKMIIFPLENINQIKTKLPEHRCLKKIKLSKTKKCNLIDLKQKRDEIRIRANDKDLLLDFIGMSQEELESLICDQDREEDLEEWSDDQDDDDDDDEDEETEIQ